RSWHTVPLDRLLTQLRVDPVHGLTNEEAARRLEQVGPNRLATEQPTGPWTILRRQLTDLMMAVLGTAALVSLALGARADAVGILAIMLLNAVLGFFQEFRAERSLEALRALAAPQIGRASGRESE